MDIGLYEAPVFRDIDEFNCARYARLAALHLFGLEYKEADAWDFRYFNDVIWNAAQSGIDWSAIVSHGHILGMFNPTSNYTTEKTGKKDCKGNERVYTHLALYVGNNIVVNQRGKKQTSDNLDCLLSKCFSVVELMAPQRR